MESGESSVGGVVHFTVVAFTKTALDSPKRPNLHLIAERLAGWTGEPSESAPASPTAEYYKPLPWVDDSGISRAPRALPLPPEDVCPVKEPGLLGGVTGSGSKNSESSAAVT